uniref:Reverse transcriptase Ty1/copia-type domain-containing protein n=1 Tax=Trichuris muris TaxID=70415 RepID=A0A5S6R5Q8_TRIMR
MHVAIGVQETWILVQADLKNADLHGKLEELIYMQQPTDFVLPESKHLSCGLTKSMYRLKLSSRYWNQHLDQRPENSLVSQKGSSYSFICVYVSGMFIMSQNEKLKEKVKKLKLLNAHSECKFMGEYPIYLE